MLDGEHAATRGSCLAASPGPGAFRGGPMANWLRAAEEGRVEGPQHRRRPREKHYWQSKQMGAGHSIYADEDEQQTQELKRLMMKEKRAAVMRTHLPRGLELGLLARAPGGNYGDRPSKPEELKEQRDCNDSQTEQEIHSIGNRAEEMMTVKWGKRNLVKEAGQANCLRHLIVNYVEHRGALGAAERQLRLRWKMVKLLKILELWTPEATWFAPASRFPHCPFAPWGEGARRAARRTQNACCIAVGHVAAEKKEDGGHLGHPQLAKGQEVVAVDGAAGEPRCATKVW